MPVIVGVLCGLIGAIPGLYFADRLYKRTGDIGAMVLRYFLIAVPIAFSALSVVLKWFRPW